MTLFLGKVSRLLFNDNGISRYPRLSRRVIHPLPLEEQPCARGSDPVKELTNREFVIAHGFNVPRRLDVGAWTNPEHVPPKEPRGAALQTGMLRGVTKSIDRLAAYLPNPNHGLNTAVKDAVLSHGGK